MERDPAWSPDGKTIAYFSDESGEYMLHLKPQNGSGRDRQDRPRRQADVLFLSALVARFEEDRLQRRPSGPLVRRYRRKESRPRGQGQVSGGPWAACSCPGRPIPSGWPTRRRLPNYMGADLSLRAGVREERAGHRRDERRRGSPCSTPTGNILYFAASTDSGQSLQPDIHSISRPVTRSIYLAVLPKDEPSPFAPESDEEKGEEKKPKKKPRTEAGGPEGRGEEA